ncbi:UNKNOWN [Stylonychia lemnae]|uniref:C2 NT-type domain-containing protein n=1 Tax=Stylonychia lemnae TaxID=5949 RepID=A0A077ZNS2_STYLE|nr:UNKNOWN [Stylonychia lemnae]|eukprot:CDW71568.1 UNKNOWN [Stylonychia lemnae]
MSSAKDKHIVMDLLIKTLTVSQESPSSFKICWGRGILKLIIILRCQENAQGQIFGQTAFDIAQYAPQLEDEQYASDPNNKLKLPLNLPLLSESQQPSDSSLEITIILGYQKATLERQQTTPEQKQKLQRQQLEQSHKKKQQDIENNNQKLTQEILFQDMKLKGQQEEYDSIMEQYNSKLESLIQQEIQLGNVINLLNQEIENSQNQFDQMSHSLNSGDPELDRIETEIRNKEKNIQDIKDQMKDLNSENNKFQIQMQEFRLLNIQKTLEIFTGKNKQN